MRATTVALFSVTSRPLSGLFLAAALFSTACSTSGLSPYSEDSGQDTAASVDDTGAGEDPGTDDDSGPGGTTDTDTEETSGCPTGEIEDCTGACLPESWLGDGLCQSRFDCAAANYDDGDCAQDTDTDTGTGGSGGTGCPSGQVEDCSGTCANRTSIGNGTCDARFDCAVHGYDDGDCADTDTGGGGTGGCLTGEIEDCSGGCVPDWWPGDGYCDAELDCAAHGNDAGDCTTSGGGGTTCPAGTIEGCDGTCVDAAWLGDWYCDGSLDCADTGYDDGDCVSCYPDEVIDCEGGCTSADWWGDGICDSGLDCATWGYDGDDCAASACPSGYIVGCDGVTCVLESWEGDFYCDAELDCSATGWDDGDCWSCWPGEVINCDGGCTTAEWIGDNICDYELDCSMWDYDYGDCY